MNKKKIFIGLGVIVLLIALVLILGGGTSTNMTAEQITNKLKEQSSIIGNIVVYDEQTDPNSNLGRPNQYTSKTSFEVTSLEQNDSGEPKGGTIEVFSNTSDMKARKNYIEGIYEKMPALSEYVYSKGNVLLRISKEVVPSEAESIEKVFNSLF